MSLYGAFKRPGPSGFGFNSTAEQVTEGMDLAGRTYLVTGANSGLGEEAARVLSLRGATVICAARTLDTASAAAAALPKPGVPLECELSEPSSVHAAVAEVVADGHQLDGIIANAGIMAVIMRSVQHGLELQFLTNHVGHFILGMACSASSPPPVA